MIFEGAISVKAILEEQKRKINKVFFQEKKPSKNLNYILHLCHKFNIEFEFVSKERIDELASGHTHGGILVDAEPRMTEEMNLDLNFYLYLEGIEDPYNLGAIIRTAAISGVQAILVSQRDYTMVENTILKSSAGLSEKIQLLYVIISSQI